MPAFLLIAMAAASLQFSNCQAFKFPNFLLEGNGTITWDMKKDQDKIYHVLPPPGRLARIRFAYFDLRPPYSKGEIFDHVTVWDGTIEETFYRFWSIAWSNHISNFQKAFLTGKDGADQIYTSSSAGGLTIHYHVSKYLRTTGFKGVQMHFDSIPFRDPVFVDVNSSARTISSGTHVSGEYVHRHFRIRVDSGYVELGFERVSLGSWDTITLYDGVGCNGIEGLGVLLHLRSTDPLPVRQVVSSGGLTIVYQSPYYKLGNGFTATFQTKIRPARFLQEPLGFPQLSQALDVTPARSLEKGNGIYYLGPQDGSFSGMYAIHAKRTKKEWRIVVSRGRRIQLSFSRFMVQGPDSQGQIYDYVSVFEGVGTSAHTQLGFLTRNEGSRRTFTSTSNSLTVYFSGDGDYTGDSGEGFVATYKSFVGWKTPTVVHLGPASGVIESPPGSQGRRINTHFKIEVAIGAFVKLELTRLELQDEEVVQILDGETCKNGRLVTLARLSGVKTSITRSVFTSSSNTMTIVYKRDSYTRGFKASYSAIGESDIKGVIDVPNTGQPGLTRTWNIRAPPSTSKTLKITFHPDSVIAYGSYLDIYQGSGHERVHYRRLSNLSRAPDIPLWSHSNSLTFVTQSIAYPEIQNSFAIEYEAVEEDRTGLILAEESWSPQTWTLKVDPGQVVQLHITQFSLDGWYNWYDSIPAHLAIYDKSSEDPIVSFTGTNGLEQTITSTSNVLTLVLNTNGSTDCLFAGTYRGVGMDQIEGIVSSTGGSLSRAIVVPEGYSVKLAFELVFPKHLVPVYDGFGRTGLTKLANVAARGSSIKSTRNALTLRSTGSIYYAKYSAIKTEAPSAPQLVDISQSSGSFQVSEQQLEKRIDQTFRIQAAQGHVVRLVFTSFQFHQLPAQDPEFDGNYTVPTADWVEVYQGWESETNALNLLGRFTASDGLAQVLVTGSNRLRVVCKSGGYFWTQELGMAASFSSVKLGATGTLSMRITADMEQTNVITRRFGINVPEEKWIRITFEEFSLGSREGRVQVTHRIGNDTDLSRVVASFEGVEGKSQTLLVKSENVVVVFTCESAQAGSLFRATYSTWDTEYEEDVFDLGPTNGAFSINQQQYKPYMRRTWRITVPPGKYVGISFPEFSLALRPGTISASVGDHIRIIDGSGSTLGLLTGKDGISQSFTSSSNEMHVVFQTDGEGDSYGFVANFLALDLEDLKGAIANGPGVALDQIWRVIAPVDHIAQVLFTRFNLSFTDNIVSVYDGVQVDPGTELVSYKSIHGLGKSISSRASNALTIQFHEPKMSSDGFKVAYAIVRNDSRPVFHTLGPKSKSFTDTTGGSSLIKIFHIKVARARYVQLEFTYFHLSGKFDTLDIYDGFTRSETNVIPRIARLQNDEGLGQRFVSSGRTMTVIIKQASFLPSTRISATYKGVKLNQIHGVISDGDSSHNRFQQRVYRIIVPKTQVVKLLFKEFSLGQDSLTYNNFVDIYDGAATHESSLVRLARLHGTQGLDQIFMSSSNKMTIAFHAVSHMPEYGCKAEWTPESRTHIGGRITDGQDTYGLDQRWRVVVPLGSHIRLSFTRFLLYVPPDEPEEYYDYTTQAPTRDEYTTQAPTPEDYSPEEYTSQDYESEHYESYESYGSYTSNVRRLFDDSTPATVEVFDGLEESALNRLASFKGTDGQNKTLLSSTNILTVKYTTSTRHPTSGFTADWTISKQGRPTKRPTITPTLRPTRQPTDARVITAVPTATPTYRPTKSAPTQRPTRPTPTRRPSRKLL